MTTEPIDATSPIQAFLDAAAAKQPTPGGGSVTALAGALAMSMGEMVLNYSVGKKDLAAVRPELEAALREFTRARELLLRLMVEDQDGFAAMQAARKLPETDPTRQAQIDAAVLSCVRVPQTIGVVALAAIELAGTIIGKANKYLLSDLAVCAELAMATVRCAAYNVRVNLPDVTDADQRSLLRTEIETTVRRGVDAIKVVIPAIWERIGT